MSATYHSRTVSGQQEPLHPNLQATVCKHLSHPFQRPLQPYNQDAVARLMSYRESQGAPALILDSGCGIGESTRHLSEQFPDHLVVGIDQSLNRLRKSGADDGVLMEGNLCLLRADVVDCWRLLQDAAITIARHFILYPNPWPKKKHLQRRWHGHPVFSDMIRLSPQLELRSNWKTYVDEFAVALETALPERCKVVTETLQPESQFLTPFEKKYALSGQTLHRLNAEIALKNSTISSTPPL